MKKVFHNIFMVAVAMTAMHHAYADIKVSDVRMKQAGDYLDVNMTIDFDGMKVSSNRAYLFTPLLINGSDTLKLPAVGVYGRSRYYHYLRSNGNGMISGPDELSFKASDLPDTIVYNKMIPYSEWMDGARFTLHSDEYGCCRTEYDSQDMMLASFKADHKTDAAVFFPELVYIQPQAETIKNRALEGSAFIDFPVNHTEILQNYRSNALELAKIQATIDSARSDKDVTITQVWLKGFASPEGGYAHNKVLAMGRTAALRDYIQQLYKFDDGIIATDSEPEDWTGLRKAVENSNINHKAEIIEMIESSREPDSKEQAIKAKFPAEYQFMLQNYYPALRHTDYRIAYNVRHYNDVEDIKRIFESRPQNLGLNEFYILAQEYEPATDEFTEVFETAVRMFPEDETANLNAANAAMRRNDLQAAERYISKAGTTAEADYAHGALAIRKGDIQTAREWLQKAKAKGLQQAGLTLNDLNDHNRKEINRLRIHSKSENKK